MRRNALGIVFAEVGCKKEKRGREREAEKTINCALCLKNDNNINYIDEYRFIELPKSSYDFAIIENNKVIRLIEFDGEQHYKDIPSWGGLEL